MKPHWLKPSIVILLAMMFPAVAAVNPANMPVTPTIASLRVIPAAAGPTYANVQVQDYYGTGSGCPIQYKWNASDSRTDDGGAIINPTGNGGNGRWNLNLPPNSPVHSCVYGIKVDTPVLNLTPVTDNSTQLQRMANWAYTYGPNLVFFDSIKGFCIGYSTPLAPNEGEIFEGNGTQQYAGLNPGNSCLVFPYTTVGYAIALQTPYPGNGQTPFESPKFRDFNINMRGATTSAGGCIQLNSIAGGFSDASGSQQPIIHPEITNVSCILGTNSSNVEIGFQCSKCADGTISKFDVYLGGTGIDLEGSENIQISGGRITNTVGPMVKFIAQSTFGNNDSIHNYQFLSFANFGQSVDSFVHDEARSSSIYDNLLENFVLPDANIASGIYLHGGFSAGIHDNQVTIASTIPWLKTDTVYDNITAINNGTDGGLIGQASFSNSTYYYSSSVRQSLAHYGNGVKGDYAWPYNTNLGQEQFLFPKVRQTWTPSTGGLQYPGYGASESPTSNDFTFPVTGSGNYLDFLPDVGYAMTGTFDIGVFAWQTTSTGQITCQITDNDTLVGSPIAQATTSTPTWYTIVTNQVVSTQAGVRCWNTGTGTTPNPAILGQINLQDH